MERTQAELRHVNDSYMGAFWLALPTRFGLSGGKLNPETTHYVLYVGAGMVRPYAGSIDLRSSPPTFTPNRMATHEDVLDAIEAVQSAGLIVAEAE